MKKLLVLLMLLVLLAPCALAEVYEGVGAGKNGDVHVSAACQRSRFA